MGWLMCSPPSRMGWESDAACTEWAGGWQRELEVRALHPCKHCASLLVQAEDEGLGPGGLGPV